MGFFSDLWEAIKRACRWIVNVIKKVIHGVINFLTHVLDWFKKLEGLIYGRHIPFLAKANDPAFRDMLKNAPVKKVGVFKGVYDEQSEEIIHHEVVEADNLDERTRSVLGNEPLVVLN